MNDDKMLKRGLVASVIAAICCFTPFLVFIVAGVGLSAYIGWLDYALFPLLFAALGVVVQALWLRAGRPGRNPRSIAIAATIVLSALLFWLQFRFALRLSIAAMLAVGLYELWLRRAVGLAARSNPN